MADGFDVLICTGDRDTFQLVGRARHRALPEARRLRAGPDDAGRGAGALQPQPRAVPGLRRDPWRPVGQPAQHPERGGEDGGQVDRPVRRRSTSSSPASTRSRARPGTPCAPTSGRSCEPPAHRPGRDVPLDAGPGRPRPPGLGPRAGAPALRHAAVPRAARPALRDPRAPPTPRRTRASTCRCRRSSRAACAAGWTRMPAARRRRGLGAGALGAWHRRRGARGRGRRRRPGCRPRPDADGPARRR